MAWKQLKNPNLAVTGKLGYCLVYAREIFGIGSKYPTAWAGWTAATLKHTDQSFPNVAVPVWFDYYQNGIRYGHVAVRLGNGQIYSSPYRSGTTHAVLNSIGAVEASYRCKYVGWSEDINGVQVAQYVADAPKGEPPMTTEQERNAYRIVLGRGMEHGGTGRSGIQFIVDSEAELTAQRKAAQDTINNLQAALANEQNKPPKEIVKEVEKVITEYVDRPIEVPVEVEKPLTWKRIVDFIREQLAKIRRKK